MARWKEQLARIQRWLKRLEPLVEKVPFDRDAALYLDDVHAFFVELHSFKDWLKNDQEFVEASNEEIEDVVRNSIYLSISADIANGKKHLKPDAKRTRGEEYRSGSKPFLVLNMEVMPDGDEEVSGDVSPRRHKREENLRRGLEAMNHADYRSGTRDLGNEWDSQGSGEDEDWERAASNADTVKSNWIRQGFAEDQIFILVLVDVYHNGRIIDLSDGIVTLGRQAIGTWEAFFDNRIPGWREIPI